MSRVRIVGITLAALCMTACFSPLNVKYVDKEIAKYKAGNVVSVDSHSVVTAVLAIELMKQAKFVIADGAKPANYRFAVNALYSPQALQQSMPVTYSFSVVSTTGEIIYIKAISGGDMTNEFQATLSELAGLLL